MTYFTDNYNEKKHNQISLPRNPKEKTVAYILASSMIVILCLFTWSSHFHSILTETKVIILDPEVSILHSTSKRFLSFAIDASLFRNMNNLPILNKKFINLARHLSPAYVRFGGTSADCLFFNQFLPSTTDTIRNPINDENITNFTITEKDFLSLYQFTKNSGNRMIFDLNVLIRKADGTWDDSNARQIVEFTKSHGMTLDWQLGNEPPSFPLIFNLTITPEQLANDYYDLRSLLNCAGYKNSILVGPEVNQVGGSSHRGENYAQEFLKNPKNSVNYVSWHQYYMRGENAQVKDFINASVFNYLSPSISSMEKAINSSGNSLPMWLSETSTAYDEGTPGITDRFVAGFLWLDKLGYSARAGLQVVIRQSFFGENYALISYDLEPNPDWWVSVIFKKFVSNKVLNLPIPNNSGNLRLYAHCTPNNAFLDRVPAITIYGVNIDENPVWISIQGILGTSKSAIFLYTLTSDSLQSRSIQMNGKILSFNGDLPPFKPIIFKIGEIISIPAYSMVFIVIHGVNASDC